ncbi:hypothetical protein Tco_1165465 [Tanacetum coccineum]
MIMSGIWDRAKRSINTGAVGSADIYHTLMKADHRVGKGLVSAQALVSIMQLGVRRGDSNRGVTGYYIIDKACDRDDGEEEVEEGRSVESARQYGDERQYRGVCDCSQETGCSKETGVISSTVASCARIKGVGSDYAQSVAAQTHRRRVWGTGVGRERGGGAIIEYDMVVMSRKISVIVCAGFEQGIQSRTRLCAHLGYRQGINEASEWGTGDEVEEIRREIVGVCVDVRLQGEWEGCWSDVVSVGSGGMGVMRDGEGGGLVGFSCMHKMWLMGEIFDEIRGEDDLLKLEDYSELLRLVSLLAAERSLDWLIGVGSLGWGELRVRALLGIKRDSVDCLRRHMALLSNESFVRTIDCQSSVITPEAIEELVLTPDDGRSVGLTLKATRYASKNIENKKKDPITAQKENRGINHSKSERQECWRTAYISRSYKTARATMVHVQNIAPSLRQIQKPWKHNWKARIGHPFNIDSKCRVENMVQFFEPPSSASDLLTNHHAVTEDTDYADPHKSKVFNSILDQTRVYPRREETALVPTNEGLEIVRSYGAYVPDLEDFGGDMLRACVIDLGK